MKKEISKALKDVDAEIQEIRKKVADLNTESHRIQSCPVSVEERLATLSKEIDSHARAGRERLFNAALSSDLNADRGEILQFLLGRGGPGSQFYVVEFLCCAFNRELKETLGKELKALWPSGGIATEEKRRRLVKLEAEKLQLEQAEESIILELEGLGVQMERRPDLSPSVFLEADE
jgi:hypothetical protein